MVNVTIMKLKNILYNRLNYNISLDYTDFGSQDN